MASTREREVVSRGHRLLKERGAWFVKTTGVHLAGCPDTVVCYQGVFIGIEWKASASADRRPAQEWQLEKIRRAGGVGGFVWTMEQLNELLARASELARHQER